MSRRMVTIIAALIFVSGTASSTEAEATHGRFEFVVKEMGALAHAPEALADSMPVNGSAVLFALEDVEEYSRHSHQFRLTPSAVARIQALPWWRWVNMKAAGGRFEVRADGTVLCEGQLHSLYSSSFSPAGLTVTIPLLIFGDHRTVGIDQSRRQNTDGGAEDPFLDCREDDRLLLVLREAGVLVE